MSFSRSQQPELRTALALAWAAHCRTQGLAPEEGARCLRKRCKLEGCRFCGWYEHHLEAATGFRSTTECDDGRDYERFMARLEEIHRESAKWGLRMRSGDARRLLYSLGKRCKGHGMDEIYLRRIAAKVCGLPGLPFLHELDAGQMRDVRAAAMRTGAVRVTQGESAQCSVLSEDEEPAAEVEPADCPF